MNLELPELAQEKMNILRSQGIHSVLTQFTEIHGVAKGKLVPLDHLPDWVATCFRRGCPGGCKRSIPME